MTDPETSVYVTDREELRDMILAKLEKSHGRTWPTIDERYYRGKADVIMAGVVDSLLEWGNGLDEQSRQFRSTAGNLRKLLDERDRQLAELNGKLGERGGTIFEQAQELASMRAQVEANADGVEQIVAEFGGLNAWQTEQVTTKLFEFYRIYQREAGDSAAGEEVFDYSALRNTRSDEDIYSIACSAYVDLQHRDNVGGEHLRGRPGFCRACADAHRRIGPQLAALLPVPGVQTEVDTEAAADDCGACFRCVSPKWSEFQSHPVVCATCGNKRCPHASDHIHACTGSNAYGQPGSDYTPLPSSSVRKTGSSPLQDYARVKKSFEQLARDVAEFAERASGVRDTEEKR